MRLALREILGTLLLALLIFLAMAATVQSCKVEGSSMEPGLHDGQYILISKVTYFFHPPQRGDVVVFRKPGSGQDIIHRVVALQGDLVEIKSGELYINGYKIEEQYTQGHSASVPPREVPEGYYFIIGDNRGGTAWDIVPRENIIGKAWLCYWPPSEWQLVPNYSFAEE